MASPRNHIERALHNEALLPVLERQDTHPDWYITTSFYACVHWIRALLAVHGIGTNTNDDVRYGEFEGHIRALAQRQTWDVGHFLRVFHDQHRLSRDARYYIRTKHWYDQRLSDADANLADIKDFVKSHGVSP